jgi:hypothetical protein
MAQNRAIQFRNFIDDLSVLTIRPFGYEELTKTNKLVKRFGGQSLTLADAHGLLIMNEHRIFYCWSTDRHLGLAGAKLVISPSSR